VFFEDNFNINLNSSTDKFLNLLNIYEKSISGNVGNGLKHNRLDRGPIQKQPYHIQ
jgi:hypothetical protein